MFLIQNTLVSLDLIERFFKCDLSKCKGECCIEGDAGAPLLQSEKEEIDRNLDKIIPLLSPKAQEVLRDEGSSYIDEEGDLVTNLIEGANCVFTTFSEDGTCLCALEKGYREGKLPMLKPSSCHLYPVRLMDVNGMTAVNFHKWKICKCAEGAGRASKTRAYEFLKEPLERKFGKLWYDELSKVASEWLKTNKI